MALCTKTVLLLMAALALQACSDDHPTGPITTLDIKITIDRNDIELPEKEAQDALATLRQFNDEIVDRYKNDSSASVIETVSASNSASNPAVTASNQMSSSQISPSNQGLAPELCQSLLSNLAKINGLRSQLPAPSDQGQIQIEALEETKLDKSIAEARENYLVKFGLEGGRCATMASKSTTMRSVP